MYALGFRAVQVDSECAAWETIQTKQGCKGSGLWDLGTVLPWDVGIARHLLVHGFVCSVWIHGATAIQCCLFAHLQQRISGLCNFRASCLCVCVSCWVLGSGSSGCLWKTSSATCSLQWVVHTRCRLLDLAVNSCCLDTLSYS